jgi:hypothetical protein
VAVLVIARLPCCASMPTYWSKELRSQSIQDLRDLVFSCGCIGTHYSRLVCVFVQRLGTDEDETQLGKPNTAKLRKRKDSRQRKGMDTTNGAGTVDHAVALDSLWEEGHWRGCLVSFDCFFENHFGGLDVNTSLLDLSCGCVELKLKLFEMCVGMSFESSWDFLYVRWSGGQRWGAPCNGNQ